MQETLSDSCAGKIPWRRKWQPTPVFLPGKIPWTEEPGRLQSMGSQRVGHDLATEHTHTHEQWKMEKITLPLLHSCGKHKTV